MTNIKINMDDLLSQFGYKQTPISTQIKIEADGHSIYECPSCKKHGLFVDDGILICQYCHCEYGNLIDDSAEWRNYGNEDQRGNDPTRCGNSSHPLLIEASYGTTIGYSKNPYFNHLKKLNNWQAMPYHERSLKEVFDRLTQIGNSSGLTSNIIEYSHKLFSDVVTTQADIGETKLSRGDIRDGLIAACLSYSCKEYDVSRSPQEIAKMCGINQSSVTRGINLFYELMRYNKSYNLNKHSMNYADFIDRYCFFLNIQPKIVTEIVNLAKKVDEKNILTKNTPQAMVCGCIYFISIMHSLGITKTEISEKCKISVPTITKSYEKLLPHTHLLV